MSFINTASLLIAITVGLAACSDGGNANTAPDPVSVPAADTYPVPSGTALPEALPQGLVLDFPYHFTGKEFAAVGDNEQRLRYSVEFLEGDARAIAGNLAVSAMAAGFQRGQWNVLGDGRIHFYITKTGYGQMRAEIAPAARKKMSHPEAKGTLVMGWPVIPEAEE